MIFFLAEETVNEWRLFFLFLKKFEVFGVFEEGLHRVAGVGEGVEGVGFGDVDGDGIVSDDDLFDRQQRDRDPGAEVFLTEAGFETETILFEFGAFVGIAAEDEERDIPQALADFFGELGIELYVLQLSGYTKFDSSLQKEENGFVEVFALDLFVLFGLEGVVGHR